MYSIRLFSLPLVYFQEQIDFGLELLSKDKVYLTATSFVEYFIETIRPVDTHHTDHREEDADTDTG